MKKLFVILLTLISSVIQATNYYVSNAGSNADNGTSTATSWQTLSKVVATTFTLGDTVKLKCGDLWTETFNLTSGNVVISSYGSGAKPEIRGWGEYAPFKVSGNWSEYASGVWRMTVGNTGTRLWLNGKEVKESRTTTLTTEYCWHYDGTYFYLKAPSNPATYFSTIQISTGNQYDLVTISGIQNVTFEKINFTGSRYCLRLANVKNVTIKNCEVGYRTRSCGIWLNSTGADSCVNVNVFNNTFNSGDSLTYNYWRYRSPVRLQDMTTDDAISFYGKISNCSAYDNYMYGWSHVGIYFQGTFRNTHAYRNFITAPLVSYSRGLSADLSSCVNTSMYENTVVGTTIQNQLNANGVSAGDFKFYNNIIDGVAGTSFPEKQHKGSGLSTEAYANAAKNMEIYGNVIANCYDWGYRIQGGSPYVVTNNNIHDNNIFNNGTLTNYNHQISVVLNSGINTNTFSNNHIYNGTFPNVVNYRNANYTSDTFNSITTVNGDVVSGNDAVITFDIPTYGIKTTPSSEVVIQHNSTSDTAVINLDYPMISTSGNRYELTASIDPYSSLVLIKDLSPAYYVSSSFPYANDSNDGLSEETPWKTLDKVNATTFIAGDKILFRRGDTFYGTLAVSQSGSNGSTIKYEAYGTGANPTITGFTTVSSWTNLGGNIWESTSAVSTLSTCNMVSINGVNTPIGRYPNTGYLTFQTHSGTSSITSSSLTGTPDWTGAKAVIRTSDSTLDGVTINSQSDGTLNLGVGETYEPTDGNGFFIQGDIRTLDTQNEWYYNPTTKKILVYSTAQPINVKVASVTNLLTINGDYVTINGIDFTGANECSIYNQTVGIDHVSILNCNILFSGVYGMRVRFDNSNIENNTILYSNNMGLSVAASTYMTIRNNTIQNSGMIPGMASNGIGSSYGIDAYNCPNTLLEYNKVINSGYIGISFYGNSITVKNNFVDTHNTILQDGGGIYTSVGGDAVTTGCVINGNIVINGIGATDGTSSEAQAHGIYLDDNCRNFDVTNNTSSNNRGRGYFLHNSGDIIFTGNTSFGNDGEILIGNGALNDTNSSNTITGNKFVSTSNWRGVAEYQYSFDDWTKVGTFNNNYYARPIDDNTTIRVLTPTISWVDYNLDGWKTLSGKDANSKKAPKSLSSANDMALVYNDTQTAKAIMLPFQSIDITGKKIATVQTLQPYTSLVVIKDLNNPNNYKKAIFGPSGKIIVDRNGFPIILP